MAGDEVYGADPVLRAELESRRVGYVLAIGCDRRVPTAAGLMRADEITTGLPKRAWQRLSAGAGAKGQRYYDWALIGHPDPAGGTDPTDPQCWWLLVRRHWIASVDAVPTRIAVPYLSIWSSCSPMRSQRIGRVIAGGARVRDARTGAGNSVSARQSPCKHARHERGARSALRTATPKLQRAADPGRSDRSCLATAGVSAGDRVAWVLRNDLRFLEITLGTGMLGAVAVPVNWHWQSAELGHLLRDSAARVVFAHSDFVPAVERVLPEGVQLVEVGVPAELAAAYGIHPPAATGRPDFDEWFAAYEPWDQPPTAAPRSMVYTSGTTGSPKGVVRDPMTPEQSQQVGALLFEAFGLAPGMRTLVPAPIYHTAPNAHAVVGAVAGFDLTIMPRFDAEEFLRTVEELRIEHVQMVPTMFVRLLQLPIEVRGRYDVSGLRCVVHAAAPCSPQVKRDMIDWLGPIVREYYGGTETGAVVACDSAEWLAHPGTVGRQVADADVRIRRSDGTAADVGESGVVYVRPPSIFPAFTYHGDPAKRAGIEQDGYFTIGDVGYVDADGYLYLNDRVSDMVISGGVNIYPAEIEQCLLGLPEVRDVAVFGIPDETYGESLAAHVDADGLTEDQVRAHVRTHLAAYKVPKTVVFDSDLPREDSGKLFKRRIRDRYWS